MSSCSAEPLIRAATRDPTMAPAEVPATRWNWYRDSSTERAPTRPMPFTPPPFRTRSTGCLRALGRAEPPAGSPVGDVMAAPSRRRIPVPRGQRRRQDSTAGSLSREDRPSATTGGSAEWRRGGRGARNDPERAGAAPLNVLLVTLDQFRADSLSAAGHPLVRTPNLDRLAAAGGRLARHYSQAAPCAPGRACLYTGTYQLNNRVVGNGTPLDERFDNVARAAARAGYAPAVFRYADQAIDPAVATGPDDPRLFNWESLPPGFEYELELLDDVVPWRRWLEGLGYEDLPDNPYALLAGGTENPAGPGLSGLSTHPLTG